MKYKQIKRIFIDLEDLKYKGIWFSGKINEGEYKEWHDNGQLYTHYFCKDGKLNGEYKVWYINGELMFYRLYKDGKKIKDYLE